MGFSHRRPRVFKDNLRRAGVPPDLIWLPVSSVVRMFMDRDAYVYVLASLRKDASDVYVS